MTPSGEEISLADLRDQVIVLDFWATWCPPCWDSLTSLKSLEERFAGFPVRFFAANALETGAPQAFFDERGWTTQILLEADVVHREYVAGSLPALVVIDGQGRHVGSTIGYFGQGSLEYQRQLIEAALEASPARV